MSKKGKLSFDTLVNGPDFVYPVILLWMDRQSNWHNNSVTFQTLDDTVGRMEQTKSQGLTQKAVYIKTSNY